MVGKVFAALGYETRLAMLSKLSDGEPQSIARLGRDEDDPAGRDETSAGAQGRRRDAQRARRPGDPVSARAQAHH